MTERPIIVCLCGSTRFGDAFREANLKETLAGKIVLSIGCEWHSDQSLGLTEEDKQRLDQLHLRKIDLADEVLILNVGDYVGESTKREIIYALKHHKRIRWLERANLNIYSSTLDDWILAFLREEITEGALAQGLGVSRVEARYAVEQFLAKL